MLANTDIQYLEKKYFEILSDLFSRNLGEIITQIYSQESIITPSATAKSNTIEHSVENIVEGIIFSQLGWKVCSLPVSSDSCFEVGDAIVNIDAKSIKDTDGDATGNKVNLQRTQTSYSHGRTISFTGTGHTRTWEPKLKTYEKHKIFGEIPNLTYIFKAIYSNTNLVEELYLISIPHGQLYNIFKDDILQKGRDRYNGAPTLGNIRFLTDEIIKKRGQGWRVKLLFKRK
ncbi:MAG: hypothetical protein IJA34_17430 [Lachnospiraceae bacterium]|nr:hypothetical protein [Lachnospiraceae bacterium]